VGWSLGLSSPADLMFISKAAVNITIDTNADTPSPTGHVLGDRAAAVDSDGLLRGPGGPGAVDGAGVHGQLAGAADDVHRIQVSGCWEGWVGRRLVGWQQWRLVGWQLWLGAHSLHTRLPLPLPYRADLTGHRKHREPKLW